MSGSTTTKKKTSTEPTAADLIQRTAMLLDAMTPFTRKKTLAVLSEKDFSKASSAEIARSLLYDADFLKTAEAPVVVVRNVKARLMKDKRLIQTSLAVNAETKMTLEKIQERVLERANEIIADSGKALKVFTPGFASGKHWAPDGKNSTNGSAAYSRFSTKYYDLDFVTLVPVYIDERAVTSEKIWNDRKDAALAIEKFLHRNLGEHKLYIAQEGGSEPGFSTKTHFYVYVALK